MACSGSAAIHVTAAPPPTSSDFHINEIHYDNVGADTGEAIEIEGPAGTDVTGFTHRALQRQRWRGLRRHADPERHASGELRLARRAAVNYPPDGIQNGSPDGIALVNAQGKVLEFLSYEGIVHGHARARGRASSPPTSSRRETSSAPIGTSLQRNSAGVWASGTSSFGACNAEAPTPVGNSLSFSGRVPTDPALPVGYEDQLFATLRSPSNVTIPTTITWTSETPAIASIDAERRDACADRGYGHACARRPTDGTTATYSLPTRVAVASGVTLPGQHRVR